MEHWYIIFKNTHTEFVIKRLIFSILNLFTDIKILLTIIVLFIRIYCRLWADLQNFSKATTLTGDKRTGFHSLAPRTVLCYNYVRLLIIKAKFARSKEF